MSATDRGRKNDFRFRILKIAPRREKEAVTDAWARVRAELAGAPDAPENITEWTLTRHRRESAGDRIALRWRPRVGPTRLYTYMDLDRGASRFASSLQREGISRGDTVAILASRIPELVVALLGSLRAGAVPTVLFSSFGPEPVRRRLAQAGARLLVTEPRLYRDKVVPILEQLPDLGHILSITTPGSFPAPLQLEEPPPGTADFGAWLFEGDASFPDASVEPETPALLHFTSGTSGAPKGAVHTHQAIVAHAHTGRVVLGLGGSTRYWCTADPGWVTGVSYGILAPLARGATVFMDEADFDPARWWENLVSEGIQVLYTSPTALRLLRRMHDPESPTPSLTHLSSVFSVGETLSHIEAEWAVEVLGVPVRDTWWQTETGCIVVATTHRQEVRPGFVGRPVDGFEVACLTRTDDGVTPAAPYEVGELAVRQGWPSMVRAYLDDPETYQSRFQDGWYLSGDLASMDAEGWIRFVGRSGDMFKSAGHLVSPGEVEDALVDHPDVVDVGVCGQENDVAGTVIEAHVIVADGVEATDDLRASILRFARDRLGPALAPRAVHFHSHLPRTASGKIVRRDLPSHTS
jgi:acetyl-CoA synthetase